MKLNISAFLQNTSHRFGQEQVLSDKKEWPVVKYERQEMPGQYGNTQNSVKNEILSYAENKIIAVVGSVSGAMVLWVV